MNVSLRQLQLFAAIARLDSLTAAADEQAISQSAASQSLKELERQLGYDLFRKIGRTLTQRDHSRPCQYLGSSVLTASEFGVRRHVGTTQPRRRCRPSIGMHL